MKERFKAYLEEQFRTIRPTAAAMKYREQTLVELLERAQDLKIKGIPKLEEILESIQNDNNRSIFSVEIDNNHYEGNVSRILHNEKSVQGGIYEI